MVSTSAQVPLPTMVLVAADADRALVSTGTVLSRRLTPSRALARRTITTSFGAGSERSPRAPAHPGDAGVGGAAHSPVDGEDDHRGRGEDDKRGRPGDRRVGARDVVPGPTALGEPGHA